MKKFVVLAMTMMMGFTLIAFSGCDVASRKNEKQNPKGKFEAVEVPPEPGVQKAEQQQVQKQQAEPVQTQSQKAEPVQKAEEPTEK